MKPVDPRLLRYARTTRAFLAGSVLLGGAGAVLVLCQATLIAEIVVRSFQQHQDLRHLAAPSPSSPPQPPAAPSSPGSPN